MHESAHGLRRIARKRKAGSVSRWKKSKELNTAEKRYRSEVIKSSVLRAKPAVMANSRTTIFFVIFL
jgi:hypothetical protein